MKNEKLIWKIIRAILKILIGHHSVNAKDTAECEDMLAEGDKAINTKK
jgi:hypothetical protein